jgi:tubulin polyglutamylase TTLL6/13
MGWKTTDSKCKNLIFWSDNEGTIEFAQNLQRWQFYNHFPGMWSIAHKVELARVMDRMSRSLPNVYNFHPKSFILPLQAATLQAHMAGIQKRADRTFIVKPDRGSQGRGILMVQDYDDLADYDESAVAQAYLSPLLLSGRKFDLRIYVLVTACDPIRAYIFKEGMVRFCTQDYIQPHSSNLDESYVHLTNFSLNKNNPSFDFAKNKKSLSSVLTELTAAGIDSDKVIAGIDRIIRLTLIAGQPVLASSYHTGISLNDGKSRCFEILGFDILLDESGSPWLLEVNCMPSLASYSAFDADLKKRVITDSLKILNIDPLFKRQCVQHFKTLSALGSVCAESNFDPKRESEIAAGTEWRQLLPIIDDPGFAVTCDNALIAARDFSCPKRPSARAKEPTEAKPKSNHHTMPKKAPAVNAAPVERCTAQRKANKTVFAPPKMSRAVILANEARSFKIEARDRRQRTTEKNTIFNVFDPRDLTCVINDAEERDRIKLLRRQMQIASVVSLIADIQCRFINGKTITFDDIHVARLDDPLPTSKLRMASLVEARMRQTLDNWSGL